MSVFYDLSKTPRNILNQAIVRAIVSENNGLLFDPSDMTTMYQDAAGTIPVTAVEQPVGKILDKSGNGYHATQYITASRPTLSARKNILLATEALETQSVTTLAATYTLSFTGAGSVTLSGTATGTLTGTGTDRVSLTFTPTAGTLMLTVSGSVTKAQLELGAVAGQYQRVTTSTDYDTDERYFPKYLKFDGVDDYLDLPYMGLYANGSASVVCAGAFIKTGSETSILSERSTSTTSPAYRLAMKTILERLSSQVRLDDGMTYLNSTESYVEGLGDGISKVFSIIDSGTKFSPRVNLNLGTEKSYSRTGKLTPNNTTIGATLTTITTAFIHANLYSVIITKSALTDAQRIKCERYAARKAGVIL